MGQLANLMRSGTELEGPSGFARILGVGPTAMGKWRKRAMWPTTLIDLLTGRVSLESIQALDLSGVPFWRTMDASRHAHFDKLKAGSPIEWALNELPPRSLRNFVIRKRMSHCHPPQALSRSKYRRFKSVPRILCCIY